MTLFDCYISAAFNIFYDDVLLFVCFCQLTLFDCYISAAFNIFYDDVDAMCLSLIYTMRLTVGVKTNHLPTEPTLLSEG